MCRARQSRNRCSAASGGVPGSQRCVPSNVSSTGDWLYICPPATVPMNTLARPATPFPSAASSAASAFSASVSSAPAAITSGCSAPPSTSCMGSPARRTVTETLAMPRPATGNSAPSYSGSITASPAMPAAIMALSCSP